MVKDFEGTVSELRSRGVNFEEYDLPGLKTENGIATTGDSRAPGSRTPRETSSAISNESPEVMRKAA